ncbi:Atrial natriuretic peptide receptor 1 [Hypsibius exemplaris]|uniref:guanylate cyclase n=1 Tax=Hypsibius exemplaris TaxID=2072580 RepID=A0A1W0WV02_HYPEX|nr:Atrial natriuretic peptide receptor 1 [Hypsibius exemplaris]
MTRDKPVMLVSVHIGNNPLYGYFVAHPVYVVAIEQIKKMYPDILGGINYTNIYLPGYDLCQDGGDNAAPFFTDFYYKHPEVFDTSRLFPVLFSPECTNQVLVLADLAREFDLPLFTSVAGDSRLISRERYPTTSALASLARADTLQVIQALFKKFHWQTIALLCDKLSQYPGLNFYTGQCGDFRQLFKEVGYTWYDQPFNTAVARNFTNLLNATKQRSRIYFILTLPEYIRMLMIAAYNLELTSGDYIARKAFQTLILLTGIGPNWTAIRNLTGRFAETSRLLHNNTYSAVDEENELQICIYESTRMFAQVFVENYPEVYKLSSAAFIKRFFNRTFQFAARNYSTDGNGSKINPVTIARLDRIAQTMETTMIFDTITDNFTTVPSHTWYWFNRSKAPPDKPECGFRNNECPPDKRGIYGGIIATVSALLALAVIFGCCLMYRSNNQLKSTWWLLDISTDDPNTTVTESEQISITTMSVRLEETSVMVLGKKWHWRSRSVYAYRLVGDRMDAKSTVNYIKNNRKLLLLMNTLRSFDHPSLALFHGLVVEARDVYLVSEYGPKQNLSSLLHQRQLLLDKEFQCAFCWELIEGVDYLHSSRIGYHGNLSSMVCIIDAKYNLKISHTAYVELAELLDRTREPSLGPLFNPTELAWKPPEVQEIHGLMRPQAVLESRTKPSDVFAVAVIFFEIFTDLPAEKASVMRPDTRRDSYEQLVNLEMPNRLKTLLASCMRAQREARPTIKQFKHQFAAIKARKTNIVEHILQRLEKQTDDLEVAILERSNELEKEMQRADVLLKEILPKTIVESLRNHQDVTAEAFDCVTIMFSDLPEFMEISEQSDPLSVISFLNDVYAVFDAVTPYFDVYKVETANDSAVVASGLPIANGDRHATEIGLFAVSMLEEAKYVLDPIARNPIHLRIGINSGPAVASVIGVRMPRYCIFGDTMNTASRMESHGEGGKIHISASTMLMVRNSGHFNIEPRGKISVKGKGSMQTFWLTASGNCVGYLLETRRKSSPHPEEAGAAFSYVPV